MQDSAVSSLDLHIQTRSPVANKADEVRAELSCLDSLKNFSRQPEHFPKESQYFGGLTTPGEKLSERVWKNLMNCYKDIKVRWFTLNRPDT